MIALQGTSIVGGITTGRIHIYHRVQIDLFKAAKDPVKEITRYRMAQKQAITDTKKLYETTLKDVGKDEALIFEAQELILTDEEFSKHIETLILEEKKTAVYAVLETGEYFADIFLSVDNDTIKAKAVDVRNVASLLTRHLSANEQDIKITEPCILLADSLMPSELIEIGKDKVLGLVLKYGSLNSHVSILAASMNIPCIICDHINLTKEWQDQEIAIDGYEGLIFVLPDEGIKEGLLKKQQDILQRRQQLQQQIKECCTADGKRIYVNANISNLEDLDNAIENECDGIGLFRSEFQYISRKKLPTEDELLDDYRQTAIRMGDKRVVIRTLDLGPDKRLDYLIFPQEANPALGYKGIRICLDHKDIFKTQLRAIYRASVFGNLAVMFPMISSIEEVREIKDIIDEVKTELRKEKIAYKDIEIGIMIETPAAAVTSAELASEVNFFSAGTNDLSQYTLAVDRDNLNMSPYYKYNHPAVLRMLELAAEGAREKNVRICICGELARDTNATQSLLNMGFTEFSVTPAYIIGIKEKILHCTIQNNLCK